MKDIRVTYSQYNDLKPRETLVNGLEPNPILKDREGKEYFEAKKDMILTVSEERAKYLVEDRKLCEYINDDANSNDDKDIDINIKDIEEITLTDDVPKDEKLEGGVNIVGDTEAALKLGEEITQGLEEGMKVADQDLVNEDEKDNNDDESNKGNDNELETADKKVKDLETADKKINKKDKAKK